ncbi:hypothetical protein ASE01_06940 [Nocardioides sp. Root190]|uniref:FAD-dependent oxidoreductase n=1 Tax=Nocardioides sp. Root190 TaxID=1736488 RepID=UPI0006F494CB|nr:NAD(P)/FAD-dependent oxidoreductase [Nocardioides sp. Root190]KRB77910.1 hypothetical protein ASE01_06940 [Nocardioides sp. Root190]
MRVAVVGLGAAGAATACLLFDRGHDVCLVEQAEDPRPVGAGIWLQALGQQVLDRLDLLAPLHQVSREVSRVRMEGRGGRLLADIGYDALPGSTPALGLHRGDLFSLMFAAVRERGIRLELGARVTSVEPRTGGIAITVEDPGGPDARDLGRFDLVVGGDGARSRVRDSLGLTARDRPYGYGALWAVVPDAGQCGDTLYQRMDGTRRYLGVLPTGRDRASLFWSERVEEMDGVLAAGLDAWRERARPLAGPHAPLLDAVTELLPATYRSVRVRSSYRIVGGGRSAGVLLGDAAHAMSPQLGAGTSLALADAWTLAAALDRGKDGLTAALEWYDDQRRAHVRWYQWWTRLMMPVFQSDLSALALPRDALAPLVARTPGVPRLLAGTLSGDRTSPRRVWRLP